MEKKSIKDMLSAQKVSPRNKKSVFNGNLGKNLAKLGAVAVLSGLLVWACIDELDKGQSLAPSTEQAK